jgi:uncharacterized protein
LVGLVLGNIRLPVLLLAGSSPAAAAGANIGVSGVAAATASIQHVRAGRVNWRLVGWMLPPSVAGAVGGGTLASAVPADVLRIVIGSALLAFGIETLRPRARTRRRASTDGLDLVAAAVTGLVVGFLGGLIGLILGSLRLPALLNWVGEEPGRALGTNLVIGIAVGAAGLLGHLPGGIDWTLFVVGALASVPAALIGSRLTGRLSTSQLLRAVGVILLVAGVAAILQGAI